jgi:hypothetical protein
MVPILNQTSTKRLPYKRSNNDHRLLSAAASSLFRHTNNDSKPSERLVVG